MKRLHCHACAHVHACKQRQRQRTPVKEEAQSERFIGSTVDSFETLAYSVLFSCWKAKRKCRWEFLAQRNIFV
jgi:hypothetical protein